MEKFIEFTVTGLSTGSIYALVAIGLALIYRSTRILNFAHGDLATAGTFIAFMFLGMNFPIYGAIILGMLFGAILAIVFYFGVLVPAQRREATHLGQIVLTLAMGLMIQGPVLYFGGTQPHSFPFFLDEFKMYKIGGVTVNQLTLGTLIISLIACALFYALVQRTKLGLAMRATSENLQAAQTLGIPTRRILALSWGFAAIMGVLAGLFLAPALVLDPFFMLDPFVKGFAAAILGGLNSLPGAIVGGLILGLGEAWAAQFVSIAFKNTLAFLIIIVVLLVRPEGLLGEEFIERV